MRRGIESLRTCQPIAALDQKRRRKVAPLDKITRPQSPRNLACRADESEWARKYGRTHRLVRIARFPRGVTAPKKVRIYSRAGHFVVQWWDPSARGNLCCRVDGDLLDALARAREIDQRLTNFKSSGIVSRRLKHDELVRQFADDLAHRADAGGVAAKTVERYVSALAHYQAFAAQPAVQAQWPSAVGVNREFALRFVAFLNARIVAPNGHENCAPRPMRGQRFVLDAVRAVFEWASDPDRGHLLPAGFRNPFRLRMRHSGAVVPDQVCEPDITTEMASQFLTACDDYQLPIFSVLVFFGLRAAEPCFLFAENVEDDWLKAACIPDLAYVTKGRRDKRFPLISAIRDVVHRLIAQQPQGLLFLRRGVMEGREAASFKGLSLQQLVQEFQRRCAIRPNLTAALRVGLRDKVLHEAGALSYDDIEAEFHQISRRLDWPAKATLKDFRHLFATAMANAGMPEHYRRYLLGHAPGKDAIYRYSHVDQLARQYEAAVRRELAPVLGALEMRTRQAVASGSEGTAA